MLILLTGIRSNIAALLFSYQNPFHRRLWVISAARKKDGTMNQVLHDSKIKPEIK
jgi:hypothetical protein